VVHPPALRHKRVVERTEERSGDEVTINQGGKEKIDCWDFCKEEGGIEKGDEIWEREVEGRMINLCNQ